MDTVADAGPRVFSVADDAALPALAGLDGVARATDGTSTEFSTVYFDTAELTLTAAGITLLHRSGDGGGWHLQLPGPDGDEVVLGGTGGRKDLVPAPLRDALRLYTRGAKLSPVGRTRTERRTLELLDASGTAVAQLLDERVTAGATAPADTGALLAWREWHVECVDGNTFLAAKLAGSLRAAGAAPADRPEIAHLLGDRMPERSDGAAPRLRKKSTAAEVVGARLREQLAELEHWDVLTRWDAPDSIHKLRVATRRLRSALATFRPLLDRERTDPLRDELKWIAGLLGAARDLEVAQQHLADTIADEPVEHVLGPVPEHVDRELSAEYRTARDRALEAMNSGRYFAMVDGLRTIVSDPPWTKDAEKRARKLLTSRVAADFKRLRKRVAAADRASDPDQRTTRLHDVRKAAKRTRYAAEALIPVCGSDAERFAAAAEQVQEVLGDHHDAVTLLPRIRQLGVQAHLDGENAFSYGRLHGLEQTRIAELEAAYREAWRAASRKKLRRWLN